jgi:hypothetical protein
VVPPKPDDYTEATSEGLVRNRAAYWHSFQGDEPIMGSANKTKKTVDVPKINLLTVDSLRSLVSTVPPSAEES